MKILHLSYSDHQGGAARAASFTHNMLRSKGIDSKILVCLPPKSTDNSLIYYCDTIFKKIWCKFLKILSLVTIRILQHSNNPNLHTLGYFSIIKAKELNNIDTEIIHLHWINFEMLGIREIKKIKKPIVWTFHDAWPFMGCGHHDDLMSPDRYIKEYFKTNKNVKGLDLTKGW